MIQTILLTLTLATAAAVTPLPVSFTTNSNIVAADFLSPYSTTLAVYTPLPNQVADKLVECNGKKYRVHYEYNPNGAMVPATYPPGEPHYAATVTVYIAHDSLHDSPSEESFRIGKPIAGIYVEHGCVEDIPCDYVATALTNGEPPLVPPDASLQNETNTLVEHPGKDVLQPKMAHGMYNQDGEIVFEQDSVREFAFHHDLADVTFTHDFNTNWVSLWSTNNVSHEVGVVTSNYVTLLAYRGKTNRVVWSSENLTLDQPPQRVVTNAPKQLYGITNLMISPWYFTNIIGL